MIFRYITAIAAFCMFTLGGESQANPFQTAITVNGIGISNYEIEQRTQLLRALGNRGSQRKQAEEALISEILYNQEAKRREITVSDIEIEAGMTEYAARANLSTDQFLREVGKFGVNSESFRSFISAGVAWRKTINESFRGVAEDVNLTEVEKAFAFLPRQTVTSVRLSEIALSLRPAAADQSREIAAQISSSVKSAREFAEVARSLSIATSRDDGGAIGWVSLVRLPAAVRSAIERTPIGQITQPIASNNALFVFFKHEQREVESSGVPIALTYSVLRIPSQGGGAAREQASQLRAKVDSCPDLRSEARRYPRGSYITNTVSATEDSGRYSLELAKLDNGELAVLPIEGTDAVELLMLCERKASFDGETARSLLDQRRNRALEDNARILLGKLRGTAHITYH